MRRRVNIAYNRLPQKGGTLWSVYAANKKRTPAGNLLSTRGIRTYGKPAARKANMPPGEVDSLFAAFYRHRLRILEPQQRLYPHTHTETKKQRSAYCVVRYYA